MITSFIYVGREAIEIMLLTFMIITAIKINKTLIATALLGILLGGILGYIIGDFLYGYDAYMYAGLSVMMFYLFYTSGSLPEKIKFRMETLESKSACCATVLGLFLVWLVFFRESLEIFVFMFQSVHNNFQSWIGAGVAVLLILLVYNFMKVYTNRSFRPEIKKLMFKISNYAFLAFGIFFAYEAYTHSSLQHLHLI